MPAISSDDQAIIRRKAHAVDPLYLCVFPKQVIATALVNGTPDWSAPVANLTVDNTSAGWTDTERGQYFEVTRSGVLIYSGCIRSIPDATTLPIAAIRKGDTGFAQLFAADILDNDVVTVYSARTPFSVLSHIDGSGVLNKRYGKPFSATEGAQASKYFEPHADFGPHRHERVVEGVDASLTFTDVSQDFSEQGTLERVWRPPAAWTQTGGADEFDDPVTYDAPAGNYIMSMTARRTVHDDDVDSALGFRYVFVTDGADGDNPAFSDLFHVTVESDEQDRTGRIVTYRVTIDAADESTLKTYLYPGAFCLFQETPRYSADGWDTSGTPSAGIVDTFCGHLRRFEQVSVDANGIQTWTLTFMSWSLYCADLPIPSQLFRVNDSPAEWYDVPAANMTICRILYMVIFYHTEMARLYPLRLTDLDEFATPYLAFYAGSLLGALQDIAARVVGANVGCASDGTFYATRHISFEDSTYRSAAPVVWTWAAGDWKERLEYASDPVMKVGRLLGAGIVSGASNPVTAYRGQYGYLAATQGVDTGAELPGFIGLDQTDILERIGHLAAYNNRPIDAIPGEALGNIDVMDPATMEPHKLSIDSYAPLDETAFSTSRRVIPLNVSRTYDITPSGIVKRIRFTVEPETQGIAVPLVPALTAPGTILNSADVPDTGTPPDVPCDEYPEYDWCALYDFSGGADGDWTATSGDYGTGGYESETVDETVQKRNVLSLDCSVGVSNFRLMVVYYDLTIGANTGGASRAMLTIQRGSGLPNLATYSYSSAAMVSGSGQQIVRLANTSLSAGSWGVNWEVGFDDTVTITDPGGSVRVTAILLAGMGSKPAGLP